MPLFDWIEQEQNLTPAALTVRAQAIPVNDQALLLWDVLMPRRDVDSVRLRNITTAIYRPTADRREWNARGRAIPLVTPKLDDIEMTPIETYFKLGEREIQELMERTVGNQELFRQLVGVDIPTRTDGLALANYRRLELDMTTAWVLGQITARNPIGGETVTMSFGYDAGRYQTLAGWTGGQGGTAYANFISWLRDAQTMVGPIAGVMLRLSTRLAIQQSAPNPFSYNPNVQMNRAQLTERIQDDLGTDFQFVENERTIDVFPDGGTQTVRTKVWPQGAIAVIPSDGTVGYTGFAPVGRAFEIAQLDPDAAIDVRGMTVYRETSNGGRELTVEAQINALPIPQEQSVYVATVSV